MNLYILRHGLAVERGTPGYEKDRDRPLTAKGRRRLRQIAKASFRIALAICRSRRRPLAVSGRSRSFS